MEKSPHDSQIDAELSSIFNKQSRPGSPFIAVSPFFGGRVNREKGRLQNSDAFGITNKLFRIHEAQKYEAAQKPTSNALDLPKLTNFGKWQALPNNNSVHAKNHTNGLAKLLADNNRSMGVTNEGSKIESIDAVTSATIRTHSMVLTNPRAVNTSGGLNLQDSIQSYDEMKYDLTTFYLKSVNMFSNSYSSQTQLENKPETKHQHTPITKSIRKTAAKATKSKLRSPNARKSHKTKTTCNCKNSGCIKLYCECFRADGFCGSHCKCKDCKNSKESQARAASIKSIKDKQAEAAAFKIVNGDASGEHAQRKTCKCKRSQCQKKYCECYNDGGFCNAGCSCVGCANVDKRVN